MLRTDLARVVCRLLLLPLATPIYAAHKFPDYPVHPASEYANKATEAGVIVAVEPMDDPEQQKTYFNSHLSSRGILPVFIVIQNISAADPYLFDRSAVGLADAADVSGKGTRKTANLLTSGGLVDLSLINDVTHERENLVKKEVRSRTLSPGSSVSGFVYVPVPTGTPRKKMHLQVPLTNAQSGEIQVMNLFF